MGALVIEALSIANSGGMRLFLLVLVILAVALILMGSAIALFTLRRQQKLNRARMDSSRLESERT